MIQDSNWGVIGGSASFLTPIPATFNSSTVHCIIQEWCQGDTAKYMSVARAVHRLMVLVLVDDDD